MPSTIANKRVFISSPLQGLASHRLLAKRALGDNGFDAITFEAGDILSINSLKLRTIKQSIDECDYVFCIVGKASGTIYSRTKRTFSHEEFIYSREKGKNIFVAIEKEAFDSPDTLETSQQNLIADIIRWNKHVFLFADTLELPDLVRKFTDSLALQFKNSLDEANAGVFDYVKRYMSVVDPYIAQICGNVTADRDPVFGEINGRLRLAAQRVYQTKNVNSGIEDLYHCQNQMISHFNQELVAGAAKTLGSRFRRDRFIAIDFSIEDISPDVWKRNEHFLYVKNSTANLSKKYLTGDRFTRYFVLIDPGGMLRDVKKLASFHEVLRYHRINGFRAGIIPLVILHNQFRGLRLPELNFFQLRDGEGITTYLYELYRSCAITIESGFPVSRYYIDIVDFIEGFNRDRKIMEFIAEDFDIGAIRGLFESLY